MARACFQGPKRTRSFYEGPCLHGAEKAGVGTYVEFRDQILPRIVRAGYNTLQLMAIWRASVLRVLWLSGIQFLRLFVALGTPEDLKSLVDAAHVAGLAVIMDMSTRTRSKTSGRDSRFSTAPVPIFPQRLRGWHEA
jgi:1,4-alpha-glucan branching enzyme